MGCIIVYQENSALKVDRSPNAEPQKGVGTGSMAWNVLRDGSFYDRNDAIVHVFRYGVHAGFFLILFPFFFLLCPLSLRLDEQPSNSPITIGHVTLTILRRDCCRW